MVFETISRGSTPLGAIIDGVAERLSGSLQNCLTRVRFPPPSVARSSIGRTRGPTREVDGSTPSEPVNE